MGLAEPRKRLKISHDPNNTAWSSSTTSYGQRLMLSQGWVAGEGLGATNRRGFNSYDNAKLKVSFKDDNLGLGASLKSRDVEASRTGLDAFQGLLGRLNGRSEVEVAEVERKNEERRLAMWAQGRWGGMVFVPGGLLVQRKDFRSGEEVSVEQREFRALRNDAEAIKKAKGRGKVVGEADEVSVEEEERKRKRKKMMLRRKQGGSRRGRRSGSGKRRGGDGKLENLSGWSWILPTRYLQPTSRRQRRKRGNPNPYPRPQTRPQHQHPPPTTYRNFSRRPHDPQYATADKSSAERTSPRKRWRSPMRRCWTRYS